MPRELRTDPSTQKLYTAGWRASKKGQQMLDEHPDMFKLGYQHAESNTIEVTRRAENDARYYASQADQDE